MLKILQINYEFTSNNLNVNKYLFLNKYAFFVHINNAANVPLVNTALLTDMQINVSCESFQQTFIC